MNIVYLLIFNKRKENLEEPYMYIGSKSNCTVVNGMIIGSNGKPYYGSSSAKDWDELVNKDEITVEVIKEFAEYTDALNYEAAIQQNLDVVASTAYFNLSFATVNTYTDPSYATYKHTKTKKCVRLPRNHRMVLSGEYVGVTKGRILSEDERKKKGRPGKLNPFYGKSHSEETKRKISLANSRETRSPEQVKDWIENVAKKPKSKEHKEKIGRKNLIMLKNIETGECVRVDKSIKDTFDSNIWMNPYAAKLFLQKRKELDENLINQ